MTLPLWGLLQKSQDDASTIDDAIAAAIAAHEADPEAHLGEGESLSEHKHEDVIDHPQGSVLADKATMTEIAVRTIFQSLDGWNVVGDVTISDIPGLAIYIEDGAVENSSISSFPQVPVNFLNSAKEMLFQILGRFDLSSGSYASSFGFFGSNSTTAEGFGFVRESGNLYGHARAGGTTHRTGAISVDLSVDHLYRAFLDAYEQKIYFFIDGNQVGVVDVPGAGWEDDTGPRIWLSDTGGNDGNLFIGELYFSREI